MDKQARIAQAVNVVKNNGAQCVSRLYMPSFPATARNDYFLPIKHIITTDSAPLTPEK
ncbi:hypothetical protein [Candidatus Villigracilis affinis]|uniref:hypothetical protein n=1 Tax=Candidatus Villigracilis affinis TaxID=3140682 RepID=UPI002A1D61BF|nr:hypothetical protein [Anaerolineales bacterium]